MARILGAYRNHVGDPEMPTAEQMDIAYAHLRDCDPETDIAIVESSIDQSPVGYCRVSFDDLEIGFRDCVLFAPMLPEHIVGDLFHVLSDAQEQHMHQWATERPPARFRAYARHPGPGRPPTDEAAWLEQRGYEATEWEAVLVRPDLDDIPDRSLPDDVEIRLTTDATIRAVWDAHIEALRGEWDFREGTENDFLEFMEDPYCDASLWKVAWSGDVVVGQVKSYINTDENAERSYLRGYTENISTHADWRGRGIAGTLLADSLRELRTRGMTEAALGVDTNNPGGAFHLYTSLGFELQSYEAVYTKPIV